MAIFNRWPGSAATAPDYEPAHLQPQITQQCDIVKQEVVVNIRRCGDATSQVSKVAAALAGACVVKAE